MKSILFVFSLVAFSQGVFGSTAMAAGASGPRNNTDVMRPFALSCSTGSSAIFPGGYLANKTCNGQLVSGIGTTLSAANTNSLNFGQVGASGGRYCSTTTSSIRAFNGGYHATFWCSGQQISGVGSTATDTGINALAFAEVEAAGGRLCSNSSSNISAFPGGYHVTFWCSGQQISGMGSTATAAGVNAADSAEIESAGGRLCSNTSSSISAFQGGYHVSFSCSGQQISGVGSNATDAGANAADFALLESAGGPICANSTSNIRAFPGGYEVQFWCSGRYVIGTGSTVTAAGQDALLKAEAL